MSPSGDFRPVSSPGSSNVPSVVSGWYDRAAADPARVVLADLGDPRADFAAIQLVDEELVQPVHPIVDRGDGQQAEAIARRIDDNALALGPAIRRNEQRWKRIDYAAPRELTFEEDVRQMKAWTTERLAWLDAEIARRTP